jgi:hypothetical protein
MSLQAPRFKRVNVQAQSSRCCPRGSSVRIVYFSPAAQKQNSITLIPEGETPDSLDPGQSAQVPYCTEYISTQTPALYMGSTCQILAGRQEGDWGSLKSRYC